MRMFALLGSVAILAGVSLFVYWSIQSPIVSAILPPPSLATTSPQYGNIQTPTAATTHLENVVPSTAVRRSVPALPHENTSVVPALTDTQTKTTAPAPTQTTTRQATSSTQIASALTHGSKELRGALVNIICSTAVNSGIRSISGSGVVISPKGVILTNAHVAQYFLLNNYPTASSTKCVIRTGSPATATYKAKLMFISPKWIHQNPNTLIERAPKGTGEYDFALLAITQSGTDKMLPGTFLSVPLSTQTPPIGEPVVIGSYAAQFLSTNEIRYSLYPTLVYSSVKKIFTFATSTVDLISLGGTAASQEGSSGGGALNAAGKLAATITTSTITGQTDTRSLYAITATYIRRTYATETKRSLTSLLNENPSAAVTSFAPERAKLVAFLTKELSSSR